MLLASLTLMLSSNVTAQTTDTLVYVPEYLMQALMSDLDACDLERIELKKAKAELEKDHWHTHVEIPSPMPQGGKLWVEIETEKAAKVVVGFDLKS